MAYTLRLELPFRRSSRCSGGGCVEVAMLPTGGAAVRDSRGRTGEPLTLTFDKRQWFRFVSCLKDGEFDL